MWLRRLLLIRGQKEAAKRILVLRLESLKPMQATQMTQILNVVKVVGCKTILLPWELKHRARFENYTSEKDFIVKCYYDGKLKLAVLILDHAFRL